MDKPIYKHNSEPKNFIRSKWIEFASEIYKDCSHDFGILTFPAEAMQDLHLFKDSGFIDWVEVETEDKDGTFNYRITKGNVRCFEKKPAIFNTLSQKLIEAKVNREDFCSFVASSYSKIMGGSDKTFPVDVVNLDFEGRLYPNAKYPFDNTVKCVFEFQNKHKRNFSLFLTWPVVEQEDMNEYKELLDNTIESNLEDPSAETFKLKFKGEFSDISMLDYEKKSVIGVSKIVIKKASQNLYKLDKTEFYVYGQGGGSGRQRMVSLLFNFKFEGKKGRENIIYSNDIDKSMVDIINVENMLSP